MHKISKIWPFWTRRANFLSHLTPLDAAHPYTQPSTGTKLTQHAQNQQNLAILDTQGEFSLAPAATPASRANFLSLIHHLGDDFHAADRRRLPVLQHHAMWPVVPLARVSCTLRVASDGVPLRGVRTSLIRASSVLPVSTGKLAATPLQLSA